MLSNDCINAYLTLFSPQLSENSRLFAAKQRACAALRLYQSFAKGERVAEPHEQVNLTRALDAVIMEDSAFEPYLGADFTTALHADDVSTFIPEIRNSTHADGKPAAQRSTSSACGFAVPQPLLDQLMLRLTDAAGDTNNNSITNPLRKAANATLDAYLSHLQAYESLADLQTRTQVENMARSTALTGLQSAITRCTLTLSENMVTLASVDISYDELNAALAKHIQSKARTKATGIR
jgi:hypothetical protein